MADFALNARLAADTFFIGDWRLSRVVLMNDARFPWLVLVPRVAGAVEIFDLGPDKRHTLTEEIARAGTALKSGLDIDKINVGALGNLVPQLHVHVVGRRVGDPAWPGPVWGTGTARPYGERERSELLARLSMLLA